MEWLPATIHEHVVCQVPETDRTWQMKGEMVALPPNYLEKYRNIIDQFCRRRLNESGKTDGRKLWVDLESFLRSKYEGLIARSSYASKSIMGDAFAKLAEKVLRQHRRPLVFADTSNEAEFLLIALRANGLDAKTWASVASERIAGKRGSSAKNNLVIVANKAVEGQGINMQHHADTIICRPTPGDHLEQMKGRIDRPGQTTKELLLYVVVCEHSIEEAKFANIRLAGNFFREYVAPVASRYREQIDMGATLAAGGKGKLKPGTVSGTWRRSLEAAGRSGCFASIDQASRKSDDQEDEPSEEDWEITANEDVNTNKKEGDEPKYKPLNKVIRNKGDPRAVRQAKTLAKSGHASLAVRQWLFGPKVQASHTVAYKGAKQKQVPKFSLLRFSDTKPVILDRETVEKAVVHLTKNDPKLAALIARVGVDALVNDCGTPRAPTQARLFDRCVRAITFTMVSVDAGNAFLRRLTIKVGVCLENVTASRRKKLLAQILQDSMESGDDCKFESPEDLLQVLLEGRHDEITFTAGIVGELVKQCEVIKGKRTGYPVGLSRLLSVESCRVKYYLLTITEISPVVAPLWTFLPMW
jgi:hypothetical protein